MAVTLDCSTMPDLERRRLGADVDGVEGLMEGPSGFWRKERMPIGPSAGPGLSGLCT